MGDWIINDIDPYRMMIILSKKKQMLKEILKYIMIVYMYIFLKFLLGYKLSNLVPGMYFLINSNFIHTHSKIAMCFECS